MMCQLYQTAHPRTQGLTHEDMAGELTRFPTAKKTTKMTSSKDTCKIRIPIKYTGQLKDDNHKGVVGSGIIFSIHRLNARLLSNIA